MRLRLWLFALSFLTLAGGGIARASVRASGLECTATGGAVVSSSPDGRRLLISNVSPSGLDGVTVSLSGLDGHRMSCATPWTGSDAGTVCSYSWGISQSTGGGGAGGLGHGRLAMTRTPDGVTFTCDLTEMTDLSTAQCNFYSHDALVASVSCPVLSTFELLDSPGQTTLVPEATFEMDRGKTPRCLMSVGLASSRVLLFGGSSRVVDRVVLVVTPRDASGEMTTCVMRCASSTVHDLDIDSQSVVRFGVSVSMQGMELDGTLDGLHLATSPLYEESSMEGKNPLYEQVYGPSGGIDCGILCGPLSALDHSSPMLGMAFSRSSPFTLQSVVDDGASLTTTVLGTGSCSPTGEVASITGKVVVQDLHISTRFDGMCAVDRTVTVLSHGQAVFQSVLPFGNEVVVQQNRYHKWQWASTKPATKSSSNIQNNVVAGSNGFRADAAVTRAPGSPSAATVVGPEGLDLSVAFAGQVQVCVNGTCSVGDEIVIHGQCASGSCSAITLTGSNFSLHRATTGSGGGELNVLDFTHSGIDQVFAVTSPTTAVSNTMPVVRVPVVIERVNTTPARGTSARVRLSPRLRLASAITEGTYFSASGTTQMFVLDEGDNSYTVDLALLGPGCGPTSNGRLFTVPVERAPGATDGLAWVSVEAVELADCSAGALPSSAGGRAYLMVDGANPGAPSVTASQVKTGNDADGTTKISVSSLPGPDPDFDLMLIYRAAYGNYPFYSRAPGSGSVPTAPTSYPPDPARWTPVTLTCSSSSSGTSGSSCTDEPSSRDFYHYVAFAVDQAGNVSPPSSMTGGTLNYHLGDVAGGGASCLGENKVTTADMSALGSNYGAQVLASSPFACLNVGPTSTGTVDGRPLFDSRISFADLLIFAINCFSVSVPADGAGPSAAAANGLRLRRPAIPTVGQTFDVALEMSGAGDAQGVSTQLGFDPAIVEVVAVSEGELLSRQGRDGVVFSSGPGNIDAALLGMGAGLAGEGVLARVTFRVKAEGDPAIGIVGVEARDQQNREVAMAGVGVPLAGPGRTALRMAFPNPFDQSTTVVFSLSASGPAAVRVFDVAGRTVRTLLDGVQPAGERVLAWDGRDDSGSRLGAGVYMLRLEAGGHSETRAVRLVR